MQVAILAGGFGTRLSEKTEVVPKPMIEIGGRPILWHIMKTYSEYGFNDFAIALGYKGEIIKDYFVNYWLRASDLTICLGTGKIDIHNNDSEVWKVSLLDTGLETQTGGRLKRIAEFIKPETFMLTYGDGVCDVDIRELLKFHKSHGKLATVTAVRPTARFGAFEFEENLVTRFEEKPQTGEGWINGGYFVLEPGIADYIENDSDSIWERSPMERLSSDKQLVAYRHDGFWQCMDTLRDVHLLENLWQSGKAPWKVWKD